MNFFQTKSVEAKKEELKRRRSTIMTMTPAKRHNLMTWECLRTTKHKARQHKLPGKRLFLLDCKGLRRFTTRTLSIETMQNHIKWHKRRERASESEIKSNILWFHSRFCWCLFSLRFVAFSMNYRVFGRCIALCSIGAYKWSFDICQCWNVTCRIAQLDAQMPFEVCSLFFNPKAPPMNAKKEKR